MHEFNRVVAEVGAKKIRDALLAQYGFDLDIGEQNGGDYDVVAYDADVAAAEADYLDALSLANGTDQTDGANDKKALTTSEAQRELDYLNTTLGTYDSRVPCPRLRGHAEWLSV